MSPTTPVKEILKHTYTGIFAETIINYILRMYIYIYIYIYMTISLSPSPSRRFSGAEGEQVAQPKGATHLTWLKKLAKSELHTVYYKS